MAVSNTDPMRGAAARGRGALVVFCWALPGAGYCARAFQDGFQPGRPFADYPAWIAGPPGAVLTLMAVLYAIFWLNLPFILLIVGLGRLRATAPAAWRWPAIWTGAVTAGIALDPFGLWALSTPSAGAGFQWTWLTATIG